MTFSGPFSLLKSKLIKIIWFLHHRRNKFSLFALAGRYLLDGFGGRGVSRVGQVVSGRQMQLSLLLILSKTLLMPAVKLCCCFEESESGCNGLSCAPTCLPPRFTTYHIYIYIYSPQTLSHNCTPNTYFLLR